MSEPRPKTLTVEMAMRAAEKTARDLAKNGLIAEEDISNCASDIAQYGRLHQDGYQLAKRLDGAKTPGKLTEYISTDLINIRSSWTAITMLCRRVAPGA